MHTKSFHEKLTYRLDYEKKIKFNAKIKLFMRYILFFYIENKKSINFSQKFANAQTVEMYIQKKLEYFNNAYAA
jgi:hypothetical protein